MWKKLVQKSNEPEILDFAVEMHEFDLSLQGLGAGLIMVGPFGILPSKEYLPRHFGVKLEAIG